MTDPIGLNGGATRRGFLKTSAAVGGALAAGLGGMANVHAAGDDLIKVGLIGCGGRGRLRHEDSTPHAPNDAESKEHPFQHGTKQPD